VILAQEEVHMPSLRGRNPDTALLDGFHEDVNAGRLGYVDGVLVVQGGETVFEHEYDHDYAAVNAGYRTSDRYRMNICIRITGAAGCTLSNPLPRAWWD